MEQLQAELKQLATEVTKQGDDTSSALMSVRDSVKAMATTNDHVVANIQGLNKWAPAIDDSIRALHKHLEEVGTRVAILETEYSGAPEFTPGPNGHGAATTNQGTVPSATAALAPALTKGTRVFRHSPVTFDLGENSGDVGEESMHDSRTRHRSSRPPKSDFPKFDGDNPKWWKKNCEKYFHMYGVEHDTWASYATMNFVGNAALWLQN